MEFSLSATHHGEFVVASWDALLVGTDVFSWRAFHLFKEDVLVTAPLLHEGASVAELTEVGSADGARLKVITGANGGACADSLTELEFALVTTGALDAGAAFRTDS